jgi:hypothetical protein
MTAHDTKGNTMTPLTREQVERLSLALHKILDVQKEAGDKYNQPIPFDREKYKAAKVVFDLMDVHRECGGMGPVGLLQMTSLALEALDKREAKTTVREVWRNEYHDGRWFDFVDKHLAVLDSGTSALRIAVPITITETEGH